MEQLDNWEDLVTRNRITVADIRDEEHEFLILDEMEYKGGRYLALIQCDDGNSGKGTEDDGGTDIIVARLHANRILSAVTDADELYALSKIINDKFGHLAEGTV